MQQETTSSGFVRCNRCWHTISDQFYRTSCLHAFCKTCCFEYFSQHKNCPVCNVTLGDEDFAEPIDVGVGLQRSAVSTIFMEAFATNQLEEIAQASLTFLQGLEEFLSFLLSQFCIECQRLDTARERLMNENKQMKSDAANLGTRYRVDIEKLKTSLKEMENRLQIREKELRDARTAYEEERRKCAAFEKMNRRRSGHGGMTSPSSTPPISPQMMPAQHDYQQRTSYGSEQPRYPPAGPMDQGQGWSRGSVSPVSRTSSSAAPFAFSTHNAPSTTRQQLGPMPGTPTSRPSLAHRLSPARQPMVAMPFRKPAQAKFSPGHVLRRPR